MDDNREFPYYSPVEDEKTAVMKSIMNLRDIEVRCCRAAPMCYASSSDNEKKAFKVTCFVAAVYGAFSFISGAALVDLIKTILETYYPHPYIPYWIGAGSAIVIFASAVQEIGKVIPKKYEQNAKKYNQAAAEWQELELRIKAYLAAAVNDKCPLESYKQFTEECA